MQIKNRIILFAYFQMVALLSLVSPKIGLRIIEDEKECAEKRRKVAASLGGGLRVGDKA